MGHIYTPRLSVEKELEEKRKDKNNNREPFNALIPVYYVLREMASKCLGLLSETWYPTPKLGSALARLLRGLAKYYWLLDVQSRVWRLPGAAGYYVYRL